MVGYPSGQRGQTVNLLAYAFSGSNPEPTTTLTLWDCAFWRHFRGFFSAGSRGCPPKSLLSVTQASLGMPIPSGALLDTLDCGSRPGGGRSILGFPGITANKNRCVSRTLLSTPRRQRVGPGPKTSGRPLSARLTGRLAGRGAGGFVPSGVQKKAPMQQSIGAPFDWFSSSRLEGAQPEELSGRRTGHDEGAGRSIRQRSP